MVLSQGDLSLRNSAACEKEFRLAKLRASSERLDEIRNEHPGDGDAGEFNTSRQTSRMRRQRALEQLWKTVAPALVTMGVKVSPD